MVNRTGSLESPISERAEPMCARPRTSLRRESARIPCYRCWSEEHARRSDDAGLRLGRSCGNWLGSAIGSVTAATYTSAARGLRSADGW